MIKIQFLGDELIDKIMRLWKLKLNQREQLLEELTKLYLELFNAMDKENKKLTKAKLDFHKKTKKTIKGLIKEYDRLYPPTIIGIPSNPITGEFYEDDPVYGNNGVDQTTESIFDVLKKSLVIMEGPYTPIKRGKGKQRNEILYLLTIRMNALFEKLTGLNYKSKQKTGGYREDTPFSKSVYLFYKENVDEKFIRSSEDAFNKTIENYINKFRRII